MIAGCYKTICTVSGDTFLDDLSVSTNRVQKGVILFRLELI